ncbi:hypothetical protein [Reichenbachiella versicolor]|uniref:hypothetical protein n=1 Tax=Reichenbachiella versicolor TaxID=1821036 RepID=UPI000D6DEA8B|nr:hypothetical protein [Reichenbachiella versicolor]
MKQNPFSLYDFLGYLIPGSTLIYAYLVFKKWGVNISDFNLEYLFSSMFQSYSQDILFFVIMAYSLGHLMSFISSITIEKFGNWRYGYPSKTMLGYKKEPFWVFSNNNSYCDADGDETNPCFKNIGRFFLILIILPLSIMDYLLGQLLRFRNFYSKKLDDHLIDITKKKVLALLKILTKNEEKEIEFNLKEIDFNRIVHHYAFENSQHHQFRMVNYVALYGFLRNLVLIFICVFWYYFYCSIITIDISLSISLNVILFNVLFMTLTYISFMAYMKFYRRYTLEGLMLLVVIKDISTNDNTNK